jgi:ADP-heptose:LPS heptosyltransferase
MDDRPLVDAVKADVQAGVCCLDLVGRVDLVTLAAVLERATLLVTGDTGPMHLAAALDVPVVAIFGPSDPARWGPFSERARVVRVPLPCSPCNRIRRPPARCLGHVPDCLAAVSAEAVYDAAAAALDGSARGLG